MNGFRSNCSHSAELQVFKGEFKGYLGNKDKSGVFSTLPRSLIRPGISAGWGSSFPVSQSLFPGQRETAGSPWQHASGASVGDFPPQLSPYKREQRALDNSISLSGPQLSKRTQDCPGETKLRYSLAQ